MHEMHVIHFTPSTKVPLSKMLNLQPEIKSGGVGGGWCEYVYEHFNLRLPPLQQIGLKNTH